MAQTVGYDIYTDSAKRFTRVNPTGYLYNINDLQSDEDKVRFKAGAKKWLSAIVETL